MSVRFAIALLLCVVCGGPAFAQSDAAKAMVGTWELSNADRDKSCNLSFKTDPAKGGFKVDFDRGCNEAFPPLREIEAWAIVNDFLRLLDARGRIVFEFTEVESGMYEAERQGEGVFFLQNTAAAGPAFRTPEQMAGDWNVMRDDKLLCAVTLTNTGATGQEGFALRVRQPCDAMVTRFSPSAWRMDRGELVFSSLNGQSWRFEENDAANWRRIPEGADPIALVRK